MAMINTIPLELWLSIIAQLEPHDLASLMRVSKAMRLIVESRNAYWGQFLKADVHESIQNNTACYKNARDAYMQDDNIDLNKISISTLLKHPNRTIYIKNQLNDLEAIQQESPDLTAAHAVARACFSKGTDGTEALRWWQEGLTSQERQMVEGLY